MVKRTTMVAMVLSLAVGSLAMAQDYDHDRDHHEDRHERVEHHGPMRHEHEHGYEHEHEHGRWHEHEHARFMTGRYERPRGYYAHRWHRGDRLPPEWRSPAYVIPDPVVYRLRPPPPGYYWVRVDSNAVLAAVATGVVIDVTANLFH